MLIEEDYRKEKLYMSLFSICIHCITYCHNNYNINDGYCLSSYDMIKYKKFSKQLSTNYNSITDYIENNNLKKISNIEKSKI